MPRHLHTSRYLIFSGKVLHSDGLKLAFHDRNADKSDDKAGDNGDKKIKADAEIVLGQVVDVIALSVGFIFDIIFVGLLGEGHECVEIISVG